MEPMEIRANFKQATVKGGTAVLQLEILTSDANAFPILKLSGKPVVLTVPTSRTSCRSTTTRRTRASRSRSTDRRTWTRRRERSTR